MTGLAVGVRMRLAHEALTEQRDAEFWNHFRDGSGLRDQGSGARDQKTIQFLAAGLGSEWFSRSLIPDPRINCYNALLWRAVVSHPSVLPCLIDSSARMHGSAA